MGQIAYSIIYFNIVLYKKSLNKKVLLFGSIRYYRYFCGKYLIV